MARPACTEADFIATVEKHGIAEAARILGLAERNVYLRRRSLEKLRNIIIRVPTINSPTKSLEEHPARRYADVLNGIVLVGSDSHYWPTVDSVAHRAFVKMCREIKPAVIIKNGDELDFPSISRFTPIGWERRPEVADEIEETKARLCEIEDASPNSKLFWPLGNHDARFETRLATVAPQYARVNGVHLKDNFPRWSPCWAVWINNNTVVKHRFKGGINAAHNNALWSGKNIVTGHLHSLNVAAFSDYNGTRFGVDTGTMANPYGPQFTDYTEDSPKNWRAGFVVLTFHNGKLLWPEVCSVRNHETGECEFRGKVFTV